MLEEEDTFVKVLITECAVILKKKGCAATVKEKNMETSFICKIPRMYVTQLDRQFVASVCW